MYTFFSEKIYLFWRVDWQSRCISIAMNHLIVTGADSGDWGDFSGDRLIG